MKWYSQLTHLILDFYREDRSELEQLKSLYTVKVSRRWGVLRFNCRDYQTANELVTVIHLLREPVAQLRLAQHINILVKGTLLTSIPVSSGKLVS